MSSKEFENIEAPVTACSASKHFEDLGLDMCKPDFNLLFKNPSPGDQPISTNSSGKPESLPLTPLPELSSHSSAPRKPESLSPADLPHVNPKAELPMLNHGSRSSDKPESPGTTDRPIPSGEALKEAVGGLDTSSLPDRLSPGYRVAIDIEKGIRDGDLASVEKSLQYLTDHPECIGAVRNMLQFHSLVPENSRFGGTNSFSLEMKHSDTDHSQHAELKLKYTPDPAYGSMDRGGVDLSITDKVASATRFERGNSHGPMERKEIDPNEGMSYFQESALLKFRNYLYIDR